MRGPAANELGSRRGWRSRASTSGAPMTSIKITVEKHPDGYVAYPLGLSGAVVGQGDSYEAAPPMCTRRSRSTSKRSAPRLWSRIRQCSRRSSLDDRRIAMVRGQRGRHSHSAHSPRAPDHQEIHAARDLHAVTRSASTSTGLQSTRGLKHRPPRRPPARRQKRHPRLVQSPLTPRGRPRALTAPRQPPRRVKRSPRRQEIPCTVSSLAQATSTLTDRHALPVYGAAAVCSFRPDQPS